VGTHGSGTIFMTWCNLRCVYCQNYDISQLGHGHRVSEKELADIMIYLQNIGCHNINFVSPTHQVSQILAALPYAIEKGLKLPLVYNTNAYDSVDTLKLLKGIFDIYMPDTKYSDDKIAVKYSSAPGYFNIMKKAIKEMYRQVGDLIIKSKIKMQKSKLQIKNKNLENIPDGVAIKGLLVRHLVLPNDLSGTEKIMKFLASLSKNTFVNIMDQYRPCHKANLYPPLDRSITKEEFNQAIKIAKDQRLKRIYTH
jgi:putative pyruvate formate lyase activating enzyme